MWNLKYNSYAAMQRRRLHNNYPKSCVLLLSSNLRPSYPRPLSFVCGLSSRSTSFRGQPNSRFLHAWIRDVVRRTSNMSRSMNFTFYHDQQILQIVEIAKLLDDTVLLMLQMLRRCFFLVILLEMKEIHTV